MERAVGALIRAIFYDYKIYIQIDSDCDGYTSAAMLINYLHRIFPSKVENLISYAIHNKKHHGINIDAIPEGTKLVIAPDSSSDEIEIHKALWDKGI